MAEHIIHAVKVADIRNKDLNLLLHEMIFNLQLYFMQRRLGLITQYHHFGIIIQNLPHNFRSY